MNDQPQNAAGYAEQAFYFIERRRLEDARRVLREALGLYPQDPDLLFHSAQVEWIADRNEQAEATVRQVLVQSPHHAPARGLLASILIERKEYADAELLLIGLLREYPESAELYPGGPKVELPAAAGKPAAEAKKGGASAGGL